MALNGRRGRRVGEILLLSGAQSYEWMFASAVLNQPLLSFPGTLQGNSSTILKRNIEWSGELIIVSHGCLLSGSLAGDVRDNKEIS